MEASKHVLVEKPLAATVAKSKRCGHRERRGLVCVPGFNMIHEASIARARMLIQNGDLGKIVSCYVMYNIHHSEERASTLPGMVRHILTHNIYTMMYLVGRPTRVTAFKAMRHYERLDKEDLAMVLLELECGGIAHLCASFAADDLSADPWTFMVKVIGPRARRVTRIRTGWRRRRAFPTRASTPHIKRPSQTRTVISWTCASRAAAALEPGGRHRRAEGGRGGREVHRRGLTVPIV